MEFMQIISIIQAVSISIILVNSLKSRNEIILTIFTGINLSTLPLAMMKWCGYLTIL